MYFGMAWIMSPTEWTVNINLNADNNSVEIIETMSKTALNVTEQQNKLNSGIQICNLNPRTNIIKCNYHEDVEKIIFVDWIFSNVEYKNDTKQ